MAAPAGLTLGTWLGLTLVFRAEVTALQVISFRPPFLARAQVTGLTVNIVSCLPGALCDARNLTFTGQVTEANTAHIEITNKCTGAAAERATIHATGAELWLCT